MTLPVSPMVLPSLLNGETNGRLPDAVLEEVQPGIWLQRDAARSFRVMRDAAKADGVDLVIEYGYRDYPTQKSIFLNRYVPYYIAGAESVVWNGQRYYKLPNVATAAVPGNSNHGWGLAVDFANASTESKPVVQWMIGNAVRFGWSAELYETWHWRRFAGNYTEPEVLPEVEMTDQEMRTLAQYIAEALDARPRSVHSYNSGGTENTNAKTLEEWSQMELQQIRLK